MSLRSTNVVFGFFILIAFGIGAISLQAISMPEESKLTYILCKQSSYVRTIRIQLNGQACKTLYTKEGVDQIVGKSRTPDVCIEIASKIKTNLEAAKWKCKDINQAQVSSSLQ